VTQFERLPLHDRLAIIVPDEGMRARLQEKLKARLAAAFPSRSFELVDAQRASRTYKKGVGSREWLVLDTIENMDGLERLMVIAVGLDSPIPENAEAAAEGDVLRTRSTLQTRSHLYRALTRAHMLVCVVNETLPRGWLAYLTRLKLNKDGAFDEASALAERTAAEPQQLSAAIQVSQPQQTQQMQRHTRVYWDIENVSIPSGINTEEAVRALERWLETRGLWGAGVVGLITAFFNPDSVGTKMRDALNRANVTQVYAGSKREDADRRLVAQLWRDLELLPIGAATAVVFITADMVFIEQLRRVKERGGPTVLLTTAPHGSAHYIALANSATETHSWRDIVCTAPAETAAAEKAAAEEAAAKKAKMPAKNEKQQKEWKKGATVGDDDGKVAPRVLTRLKSGLNNPLRSAIRV
jgi:hypothetical protein